MGVSLRDPSTSKDGGPGAVLGPDAVWSEYLDRGRKEGPHPSRLEALSRDLGSG